MSPDPPGTNPRNRLRRPRRRTYLTITDTKKQHQSEDRGQEGAHPAHRRSTERSSVDQPPERRLTGLLAVVLVEMRPTL
jgi:hypothetical protein